MSVVWSVTWRLVVSVLAFLAAILIAAAAIEIAFGTPRPGFVPMGALIILAPTLFVLWRPLLGSRSAREP